MLRFMLVLCLLITCSATIMLPSVLADEGTDIKALFQDDTLEPKPADRAAGTNLQARKVVITVQKRATAVGDEEAADAKALEIQRQPATATTTIRRRSLEPEMAVAKPQDALSSQSGEKVNRLDNLPIRSQIRRSSASTPPQPSVKKADAQTNAVRVTLSPNGK